MFIQQLYTNCLSEAAYYIESAGEAAIIDPIRDIDAYINLANERNATIKYIFETHFHADFISGHIDLSKATGAPIIYGPQTTAAFDFLLARDGEIFTLGNLEIKILHTPGHTMESSCYLLYDEEKKPHALFTGDTLFVGGVGRPDLAQKANEITTEDLAGILYESLREKIIPLPDAVIVYPGHGPGSSCGKHLGPKTVSTIGEEKQSNYALQALSKEEFIKAVTEGMQAPPQYFPINAAINKKGYTSIDTILVNGLQPLSEDVFDEKIKAKDCIILDSRKGDIFADGFVPGAINIGLEGRFAEWAGNILPFDKTIFLVTEPGKEKETVIRLARVGFDKVAGYLEGGFEAWKKAGKNIDMVICVEPDELILDMKFDPKLIVLDVRNALEFADGHLKDAVHFPLSEMTDPGKLCDIEDADNLYIHCAGGYRSMIACSLLKREGIYNVRNVLDGWAGIRQMENIEIEKSTAVLN